LVLSGLALWTFYAHWRLALGLVRPGSLADKLRMLTPIEERQTPPARPRAGPPPASRPPLWRSQEMFVAAGLAILVAVYGYFVPNPCRLTLRHSPWRYFLYQILMLKRPFPWGDYRNWQIGLIVIVVCGATFAALAAAAGLRVLMAYRNTAEPRRPTV